MWEYTYAGGARSADAGPVYRSADGVGFPGMEGKLLVFDWSRTWNQYADVVNGTFASDTENAVRTDGRSFRMSARRLANIRTFDVLEETSPPGRSAATGACTWRRSTASGRAARART
jgi:hypothetical protein